MIDGSNGEDFIFADFLVAGARISPSSWSRRSHPANWRWPLAGASKNSGRAHRICDEIAVWCAVWIVRLLSWRLYASRKVFWRFACWLIICSSCLEDRGCLYRPVHNKKACVELQRFIKSSFYSPFLYACDVLWLLTCLICRASSYFLIFD